MATYTATVHWTRQEAIFTDLRYSRAHRWQFDGGLDLPASSSPHHVKLPYSDPAAIDPEEAYVAALASCHMLGFLYFAARRGYLIDIYADQPAGELAKDDEGREMIAQVTLKPHVVFAGDKIPTAADLDELHHEAHEACYLANSVKTVVVTNGTWQFLADQ